MIVGEVKQKKNPSCVQNQTWVLSVIKPTSIRLRHFDIGEAVCIWGMAHGRIKLEKIMHHACNDDNSVTQSFLCAKSNGERSKSKPLRLGVKVCASPSRSPHWLRVKAQTYKPTMDRPRENFGFNHIRRYSEGCIVRFFLLWIYSFRI